MSGICSSNVLYPLLFYFLGCSALDLAGLWSSWSEKRVILFNGNYEFNDISTSISE